MACLAPVVVRAQLAEGAAEVEEEEAKIGKEDAKNDSRQRHICGVVTAVLQNAAAHTAAALQRTANIQTICKTSKELVEPFRKFLPTYDDDNLSHSCQNAHIGLTRLP